MFNVVFGLFAAYVLSRHNFYGRNALIVTISLPTAIPTAVAGFALLLLWGPYGTLGRLLAPHGIQINVYRRRDYSGEYLRHFSAGLRRYQAGVRHDEPLSRRSFGDHRATRWQTFWHVTLPSLRGAIVSGALLNFARAVGEFGSTILVSGNLAGARKRRRSTFLRSSTKARSKRQTRLRSCWRCFHFLIFSVLFSRAIGWMWIDQYCVCLVCG